MENIDKDLFWKEVLETIKISVSQANFGTWFIQTHLSSIVKNNNRYLIQIGCSSPFVKLTIENRYFGLIQETLAKSLGAEVDLAFIVKENPKKTLIEKNIPSPLFNENPNEDLAEAFVRAKIRKGFSFENFAVSSSNQMAWAATEAVSENPGTAYNPLFIWGGVGVGKTHLMLAVGYEILKRDPKAKVLLCTGEDFTNDIVEGIRNKTTQVFRDKYRKLKTLLVDDIQFIAGKDAVQEEFFHTFNAVTASGGQVVLTSDKPPSEISKLEERLKSRFEAGLIVDISPPNFELRCAILQIKSKEKGIELTMDVVGLIAGNMDAARKMEGFLVKLVSEARLKKIEITEDLVKSLIGKGEEASNLKSKAAPPEVISAVSKYYSLNKRVLLGESRTHAIALPRQILMYLLRLELGLPLEEVGRLIGRDHSTVIHAVDKITSLASLDVNIREDILRIKNAFWG